MWEKENEMETGRKSERGREKGKQSVSKLWENKN